MKPQFVALPLVGLLLLLVIGIAAGPLWVTNATLPVRLTLTRTVQSISGFGSWFSDIKKLTTDRDKLAEERNGLLSTVAELQADKRENEALKKELNLINKPSKDIIMAHTAGLSQSANTQYLLIDKGSDDGVKLNQIVISTGILVGRIKQVASHTALIQLPTSLGSTIPVSIRHGEQVTKGVIEGKYNLTALLTQVLPTDKLEQGDVLETSADGGIYPPGIVVGKVGQIDNRANQVFQSSAVELLWDIRQLEFVFVIK